MMWSLASLGIGLFKWLFDKPSKVVRYLADSSYWLYLIHLPIVIWLQIAFAELAFHWSLKLIAISLLTIGIQLEQSILDRVHPFHSTRDQAHQVAGQGREPFRRCHEGGAR
jgi:hypothetical protein